MKFRVPATTDLENWSALTETNAHTRALMEICKWCAKQCRYTNEHISEIIKLHKAFEAVEVVKNDLGYLPSDLYDYCQKKMAELLELINRDSPEVAKIINKVL